MSDHARSHPLGSSQISWHRLNQLSCQALSVRADGREMHREIAHVGAESDPALSFESSGDSIPTGDQGLAGLEQGGSCWI